MLNHNYNVFLQSYAIYSSPHRGSTWVSLEWHWTEPSWIDWTTTCSPVCQPWIICNDIQSISRGLAACIHCGKWTAQSKAALEKLAITRGRALTQNAVPLTQVATSPASMNGRPDCWIPCEPWASVSLPPPSPSCCLIEPCFTQKATLSLFEVRRLWQHLPFLDLHVTQHGQPITAHLYMVMKVWRRDDKTVMSLALWPGVNFGLITHRNKVQVVSDFNWLFSSNIKFQQPGKR